MKEPEPPQKTNGRFALILLGSIVGIILGLVVANAMGLLG